MDKLLAEYDKEAGLQDTTDAYKDVEEYLQYNIEIIERLTSENCFEIAARLIQYAIHLQRLINKESCRMKWCNAIIERVCAREWNNYDQYMKANMKMELIARENEMVNRMIKLRNRASIKLENLNNIGALVRYYSDVMIEGARTKRRNYER